MSDWLFDLGNTRLKLAPLDPDGAGPVAAFGHSQELDSAWSSLLPSRIDVAWVASVGPAALRASLLQVLVPRAARVVEVRVERETQKGRERITLQASRRGEQLVSVITPMDAKRVAVLQTWVGSDRPDAVANDVALDQLRREEAKARKGAR